MLCETIWTGALQYRITTSGGRTANATEKAHAERMGCPKSATAHTAHTHTAKIAAFTLGCTLEVYRLCAAFDVLECTPAQAALTRRSPAEYRVESVSG
jgi:hypothetical protein